jgi:hypothetical protein
MNAAEFGREKGSVGGQFDMKIRSIVNGKPGVFEQEREHVPTGLAILTEEMKMAIFA